jgi:hypothetical protein
MQGGVFGKINHIGDKLKTNAPAKPGSSYQEGKIYPG